MFSASETKFPDINALFRAMERMTAGRYSFSGGVILVHSILRLQGTEFATCSTIGRIRDRTMNPMSPRIYHTGSNAI